MTKAECRTTKETRTTNNQSARQSPVLRTSGFVIAMGNLRPCRRTREVQQFREGSESLCRTASRFPSSLTLSHGEREQPAAGPVVREVRREDTALGCAESQRRILPLPEGEGWGEGEADSRSGNRVGTSPEVCGSPEGPYGFEPFILSCLRLCRRSLTLPSATDSTNLSNWPDCKAAAFSPRIDLRASRYGRRNETIVRHPGVLSPGVTPGIGLPPVSPQSLGSNAAFVVQKLMWPSPQRTLRPYGFLPVT